MRERNGVDHARDKNHERDGVNGVEGVGDHQQYTQQHTQQARRNYTDCVKRPWLHEIARLWFGMCMAMGMVGTAIICKIISYLLLSRRTKEGMCLLITQAAWRLTLLCSPWIKITPTPACAPQWQAFQRDMGKDSCCTERQPAFVIGNHSSFLDTILTVAVMPASVAWHSRTYLSSHLFDIPMLSRICNSIGHFPVYFTNPRYGQFSVDRAKMEKVQADVDKHLSDGGVLAFFPEGQMNKTPDQLCDFRYGGFKKALDTNARIWSIVMYNNHVAWPVRCQMGGFPSDGMYDLRALAPGGCRELVARLRATLSKQETERMDDVMLISTYARKEMQGMYDGLKAKCEQGNID